MARQLVVAVGGHKGGVGKTTTVLGLAEAAAARGMAVTVIDLDTQASATWTLNSADPDAAGSKEVLRAGSTLRVADVLVDTAWPGVRLCQAEYLLSNAEAEPSVETRLRDALHPLDRAVGDLVLIDLPPRRGRLMVAGLAATDLAVAATEAGMFSAVGAGHFIETLAPIARQYRPTLTIAGIIVTRYAGHLDERRVIGQLETAHPGLILTPAVPRHAIVPAAHQSYRLPLRDMRDRYADLVADAYDAHLSQLLAHRLPKGARP